MTLKPSSYRRHLAVLKRISERLPTQIPALINDVHVDVDVASLAHRLL